MKNNITTAVIMAAGLGTRFGQMTEKMPNDVSDLSLAI